MLLLDGVRVDFGQFPNKEINMNYNKLMFNAKSDIFFKYESDQDLLNLMVLKRYIDETFPITTLTLTIAYMPYSRMDRRNQFYAFTLKYVSDFINSLNFFKVFVYDAHSDVTLALLDNCVNVCKLPLNALTEQVGRLTDKYVFYPDAGAEKRYSSKFAVPSLVGIKTREFSTGAITGFSVHGNMEAGCDVVIVDDLCSKGGTFMAAATELKKLGAKNIYLVVTHCEHGIFDGDIFKTDLITKVFTTNTIIDKVPAGLENRLHITKLFTEVRRYETR